MMRMQWHQGGDRLPLLRHFPSLCAQSKECSEVLLLGRKQGASGHIGHHVIWGMVDQEGGPQGDNVNALSTWQRRAVSFAASWSLIWSCCWTISECLMWVVLVVTVAHARDGCCGG
jgi:hypothetical protein